MRIQTIVTDCDDTLLTDDLRISPFTLEVLKAAHQKGVRVILASGRAAVSLKPFSQLLQTGDPYIASNGAVIVDGMTHAPLDELFFTIEQARACAAFYQAHNLYAQFYAGDTFYYSHEGELSRMYGQSTHMKGVFAGDLQKAIQMPISKLLGMGSEEDIAILYPQARAHFKDTVSVTLSKPYFLEMNPQGATKGDALTRLSKIIDIDPQTTLAFGDSLNDITMLKWAKYGVAMANARDEVKSAVTLTCPSNTNDGVAHMIQRYVLKEEPIS